MSLYLKDFDKDLQARAKAAAALARINLKDWIEVATQEKLDQETYEDSDYETDQFGQRRLKK